MKGIRLKWHTATQLLLDHNERRKHIMMITKNQYVLIEEHLEKELVMARELIKSGYTDPQHPRYEEAMPFVANAYETWALVLLEKREGR